MRIGLALAGMVIATASSAAQPVSPRAAEDACIIHGASAVPSPGGATVTHKGATTLPSADGVRVLLRYEVTHFGRAASYDVSCVVRPDGSMRLEGPSVTAR